MKKSSYYHRPVLASQASNNLQVAKFNFNEIHNDRLIVLGDGSVLAD